jgi:hypothetical protein
MRLRRPTARVRHELARNKVTGHSYGVKRSKPNPTNYMETFLILLIFGGVPLALFAFIIFGAIHRSRQHRKIVSAAEKYIHS